MYPPAMSERTTVIVLALLKLAQCHGGHGVLPFAGRYMVGEMLSEGFSWGYLHQV